jgi:hypothetical protein
VHPRQERQLWFRMALAEVVGDGSSATIDDVTGYWPTSRSVVALLCPSRRYTRKPKTTLTRRDSPVILRPAQDSIHDLAFDQAPRKELHGCEGIMVSRTTALPDQPHRELDLTGCCRGRCNDSGARRWAPLALYNGLLGSGGSKLARFARLNASARNCNLALSDRNSIAKLRVTE